jgi:hypothetical protein
MVAPQTERVSYEILGANFTSDAGVQVDGQYVDSTTVLNSTTLQVEVNRNVSTTVGTHQFKVVQSSGTSNSSPFTAYTEQPAPVVMNALPSYWIGNMISPQAIVVADTNGDGFADVLWPDFNDSQIAILHGNADGSLSSPQLIAMPAASTAYAAAVADVDGDGKVDLISVGSGAQITVSVLLGDGQGNFQPVSSQQTIAGDNPTVVGVADLNGDGQPDLVLYYQTSSSLNLVWLKNLGQGNFAAAVTLAQVANESVVLADFNQDGKPDLLYAAVDPSTGVKTFHVLLNKGGAKFTDQVAVGLEGISGIPTVIDFDLDGIPDLTIQTLQPQATSTMYSFHGNGDGSFTQVASFNIPADVQYVTADFDHDGLPDLAGANLYLFGDGHGNFTPLEIAGSGGNAVATGDINGDGLPDMVTADRMDFLSVSLGRKDRNFPTPLRLTPGTWGNVTLGDINGDGLPEIFVGGVYDPMENLLLPGYVYLNQGNSSFTFAAATDATSFALEDLTGKGLADLVGFANGNDLFIWPNNKTLGFTSSPITVPTVLAGGVVHVADVDGDGHPDIVTAGEILFGNGSYQFTSVPLPLDGNFVVGNFRGKGKLDIVDGSTIYLNTGNRTFQAVAANLPAGFSMGVGDFNGDGKDDLILSDGGAVMNIYYSRGDGTFYQGAILAVGEDTSAFEIGDFDGDGRLDVAVGLYPNEQVEMFFNQGGGIFTLSYFATGVGSFSMRTKDLNGDGKLDLVMTDYPPFAPPSRVNVVFHK